MIHHLLTVVHFFKSSSFIQQKIQVVHLDSTTWTSLKKHPKWWNLGMFLLTTLRWWNVAHMTSHLMKLRCVHTKMAMVEFFMFNRWDALHVLDVSLQWTTPSELNETYFQLHGIVGNGLFRGCTCCIQEPWIAVRSTSTCGNEHDLKITHLWLSWFGLPPAGNSPKF